MIAHSSTSSLCTCNGNASASTLSHSLSQCGSFPAPEILYLNAEESWPSSGDAQRWRKIFESPRALRTSPLQSTSLHPIGLDSTFDLFKALDFITVEEDDGERTPTQNDLQSLPEKTETGWSDNVQQLIKETDEAFKAVGFALADVKAAALERFNTNETGATASSPDRCVLQKQHKAPIARAASVSGLKREMVVNPKIHSIKLPKSPKPTPSPRWTLTEMTEGMAGLLTGNIFNRVTADEILNLERVLPPQLGSNTDLEIKNSSKTLQSDSTDEAITTVGPFHLENLPSHIGVAVNEKYPSPSSNDVPSTRAAIPDSKRQTLDINTGESDGKHASDLQFHGIKFPSPPRTPLPQWNPLDISTPTLHTLPEISPLSPLKFNESIATSPIGSITSKRPQYEPDFTEYRQKRPAQNPHAPLGPSVLESTPYSLHSLGFRHGSIRLNHPHRSVHSRQGNTGNLSRVKENGACEGKEMLQAEKIRRDENHKRRRDDSGRNFDLTIFQTAISGGTGDYLIGGSDNLDASLQGQNTWMEKEVDDIAEWWASLGISLGSLETEDLRGKTKRRPKAKLHTEAGAKSHQSFSMEKPLSGTNAKKGVSEEKHPRIEPSTENPEGDNISLPPSFMEEQLSPMVPMGFNLENDLGDFLKWENEYVAVEL